MSDKLKDLYEKNSQYIDQFNVNVDNYWDKKATLPSGKYVAYADLINPTIDEASRLIDSYDDERDKEVVASLILLFKQYDIERKELTTRVARICNECGLSDVKVLDRNNTPDYPTFDDSAEKVELTTTRLTDGMFTEYPYCWGFIICHDYEDGMQYPFNIRFSLYADYEESEEGYQMSRETAKSCPKYEPISSDDPEFDTKLSEYIRKVHQFVTEDIDAFFTKQHTSYEDRKNTIIKLINGENITIADLENIIWYIENELG